MKQSIDDADRQRFVLPDEVAQALLQTEVEDLDARPTQQREERLVQKHPVFRVDRDGDALQHERVETQNLVDSFGGAFSLDEVLQRELQRAFDSLSQARTVGVEAEDGLLHLFALAGVMRGEVASEALEEGGRERGEERVGKLLEQREQ